MKYITTADELRAAVPTIMSRKSWGFDTETTGLDPIKDKVILLQIGDEEEQFVIDARKVHRGAIIDSLKPFFENEKIAKVLHNAKFDYKMMKGTFGIEMEAMRCTFLGEKIYHKGRKFDGFGLDDVLEVYLNIQMDKALQKSFIGHTGDFSPEQLAYAAKDVQHMLPLGRVIYKNLYSQNAVPTWELECAAVACFGDMEFQGLRLDKEHWQKVIDKNIAAVEAVRAKLDEFSAPFYPCDLYGKVLMNYGSPDQVAELLNKMGIMIEEEKTEWILNADTGRKEPHKKTLRSEVTKTDDKTLKKIKDYPIVKLIKEYRGLMVRLNTFGQPFIDAIHPITKNIHGDFDQLGTDTGRPASGHSPVNLLNIPRDLDFRHGFVAGDPDYLIETDDFSGAELRIWAELSQDPNLVGAFNRGEDLHCYVASKLYRVPVTKTENKKLRTPAKSLNFGIAYGMGPFTLWEKLNGEGFPIKREEAKNLYDTYTTELFKVGVGYLRSQGEVAVQQTWLANANGRRRHWVLPNPDDRSKFPLGRYDGKYLGIIGGIQREGGNFLIQSVNADITKQAMVDIRKAKKARGIRTEIILQVYDEIVTRTHKDDSPEFVPLKRKIMTEAAQKWLKTVPMEVEGHVGPSWTK